MGDQFVYNFPQYAVATLRSKNVEYQLLISSDLPRPSFESSFVALPSSILSSGKVDAQKRVGVGERIEIGGKLYVNKGIDVANNWLELDLIDPISSKEYLLQTGYPFRPFTDVEFSTEQPISLRDYKGKYVYVDFWGTWCKGCVREMRTLKNLYSSLDKTRFEFIGIDCLDSPERLKSFIVKEQITWPQIVSNDKNRLVDLYGVTSFPTSVLINPEGIIVAKDIYGDALSDILKKLTKTQNFTR